MEVEEFLKEAAVMKEIKHPNLVQLLGECEELGRGGFCIKPAGVIQVLSKRRWLPRYMNTSHLDICSLLTFSPQ